MSNDPWEIGNTDLIDVADVATEFDEEQTREKRPRTPASEPMHPRAPVDSEHVAIAEIKDRFAALLIDVLFLTLLYWPAMLVYRAIAFGQAAGPIPIGGFHGYLFHGLFFLIAFLWFALPEYAVSASAGMMCCRLVVRKADGQPPTLAAAALRNLLLPIDLLLLPLLVPFALMEWSGWRRRIGDLVAGTVVLRRLGRAPRQYALSTDMIASASKRALAFLFDLANAAAFAFGYALLLSPDQPVFSMLLLVDFPLLIFAFVALPEWLAQTSPGKWLFGLVVCHEDGTAIDLPSAFVRNLWRPFDNNPIGFLTALFSIRRQRPGDAAAGTVVIRAVREWKGLAALIATILVALALIYGGLQNRANFLHGEFQVNFLPSADLTGSGGSIEAMREKNFGVRNVRFAADVPENVRKPSIFHPAETLFLLFDVVGYALKDKEAWVQEDLSISYPDGSVGLKLENINDFKQVLKEKGPIAFENHIALPQNAQPGRYSLAITLRDKQDRRELKELRFFYITQGESENAAPPPGAPPEKAPPPPTAAPAAEEPPPQAPPAAPPPPSAVSDFTQ